MLLQCDSILINYICNDPVSKEGHLWGAGVSISTFFFLLYHVACGILVLWPQMELRPPAVEYQSLNPWTAREVPSAYFFADIIQPITPGNGKLKPWVIETPHVSICSHCLAGNSEYIIKTSFCSCGMALMNRIMGTSPLTTSQHIFCLGSRL